MAIDGRVAGHLVGRGSMTRAAFAVEKGEHEVSVIHPQHRCTPRTLEISSGRTVMLILDVRSERDAAGAPQTTLHLQG